MKVQNYHHTKEGNYISAFECVIYGHIEMTLAEWLKAKKYLLSVKGKAYDSFRRNILKQDVERTDKYLELFNPKRITWRNVRVDYTKKLFNHYKLPRYKQQNYVIKIILTK